MYSAVQCRVLYDVWLITYTVHHTIVHRIQYTIYRAVYMVHDTVTRYFTQQRKNVMMSECLGG